MTMVAWVLLPCAEEMICKTVRSARTSKFESLLCADFSLKLGSHVVIPIDDSGYVGFFPLCCGMIKTGAECVNVEV